MIYWTGVLRVEIGEMTLKSDRVQSSIPRDTESNGNETYSSSCPYNHESTTGDNATDTTDNNTNTTNFNWVYPSPKMFWAAMKRKGRLPEHLKDAKSESVEKDLDWIVTIHNVVNEQCWQEILKWERFARDGCVTTTTSSVKPSVSKEELQIKLQRFLGRPEDMSPRAWIKSKIFGYREPFDRHDWYVKLEDKGSSPGLRRYVIDFYSGKCDDKDDKKTISTFHLDVRPALDSVDSAVLRIKRSICNLKNKIFASK